MFCDLVGSTALSARFDPEDMREIIGAYHRCCAEQITKAGGFVAQYLGDGVLAYFGYPQAHEDDAERAVRVGLTLVDAVSRLQVGRDAALQARIGVATGLVVVGDLIGDDARERGVVGETPNLAARLQGLAKPGQVVIAQSTRMLTAGLFEYRDLGRVALKGFADPTQAWQVIGTSAAESRFEAQHETTLTPLVGREEELELMLRRWRQAASGEGRVVLLSGEPGIGKSRLTVALQERLQAEPHTRLRYFCSPQHTDCALYPVINQLERAAEFERHDTPAVKLDKLAALLGSSYGQERDLQLLAELLSIPTGAHFPSLDWSPQRKKNETSEALLRQLEMLNRQWPVLMIYEDAHWIDPSTRELLDITIERLARLPVLLVITFRPEFQQLWTGRAHVTTLSLGRLGRRESAGLTERVAGIRVLPDEIMAEIVERSDGIPLFVEELTKAVVDDGVDRRTVSTPPYPALNVPATLDASLMARLDRLGPVAKEIAQIGATIGREFSYELLASTAGRSERELQSALGGLSDAGLVSCRGAPPEATFLFKHALVRDAAYGSMLRSQRKTLHARIASVLEERFPEIVDQQPELLAQHWTEAGSIKEAIDYWIKAGRTSCTRSATVEAVVQVRKGLALLPSLVDGPERWRQELRLQIVLGYAVFATKGEGAPEAGEAFVRARDLCDHLRDRSSLGLVLKLQGSHYHARAQYAAARHIAEELLQVALERNDAALELHAREILGRSFHWRGALASAVDHFERALSVRVPGTSGQLVDTSRVVALSYSAYDLVLLGHFDQAVARRSQALALARKTNPYTLAVALSWAADVDRLLRADQSTLECLTELAAVAKEQRFALFLAATDLLLASRLSTSGKTAEGHTRARQAIADYAATGYSSRQAERLALLGYCCERSGEIDEALSLLDRGLETANATDERFFEAELHRLKGEWLLSHRPALHTEVEGCYQRALAVARKQEAKLWELRASMSLARLWRDQGKRTEARDLLAPIYGWFTEGFDTPDLKEAKALLEELG
jgi:predicted ATPase/class 3 adenylate cyclase